MKHYTLPQPGGSCWVYTHAWTWSHTINCLFLAHTMDRSPQKTIQFHRTNVHWIWVPITLLVCFRFWTTIHGGVLFCVHTFFDNSDYPMRRTCNLESNLNVHVGPFLRKQQTSAGSVTTLLSINSRSLQACSSNYVSVQCYPTSGQPSQDLLCLWKRCSRCQSPAIEMRPTQNHSCWPSSFLAFFFVFGS